MLQSHPFLPLAAAAAVVVVVLVVVVVSVVVVVTAAATVISKNHAIKCMLGRKGVLIPDQCINASKLLGSTNVLYIHCDLINAIVSLILCWLQSVLGTRSYTHCCCHGVWCLSHQHGSFSGHRA